MRYLELIEQIDILEAAKDKYLPMLNFLDQIPDRNNTGDPPSRDRELDGQIANIKRSAREQAEWAIQSLRNSDRIIWYIRLIRLFALNAMSEAVSKSLSAHQSAGGWGDLDPEHTQQAEQNARGLQELAVLLKRLSEKDARNMSAKANAEVQKAGADSSAKHDSASKKLEAIEARCVGDPQHSDCGLNKERLEAKVAELYALVNAAKNYSEFTIPTYDNILQARNQLTHFESINYQPMNDFRFGWLPTGFVLTTLALLENTWQKLQSKILVHDVEPGGEYEGIEKIMDFGDGIAWWNLHRKYCRREGSAMGHCGNDYDNAKDSDEVISLREYIASDEAGEQWIPHITGVFDTANGMLGEMKGRSNNKPEAKYHKYIIPLLKEDWIKGILMRAHQHQKSKNFYVSDLPEEIARELVEQKPDLATWKDRSVLGIEGDMSNMELDKINEQLEEWNVETIDSQRDDVFVLTTYNSKEQAYEAWSGDSFPDGSWIDNPEKEEYEKIYKMFEDTEVEDILKQYMYLMDPDEMDDYMEVPGDRTLDLETADYGEMLEGYREIHSEFPLEDFIDEKWKEYHGESMKGQAEDYVDNLYDYSGGSEYEFSVDDKEDGGLDITMDMDYFFSDVLPNLEGAGESYGTMSWERLLDLRIPDVSQGYWENWRDDYGDDDSYGSFVQYGLDHKDQFLNHVNSEIEKLKTQGAPLDPEALELRRKQQHLGLEEPEQPEFPKWKGAHPRDMAKTPWYQDWIDQMERDRRR